MNKIKEAFSGVAETETHSIPLDVFSVQLDAQSEEIKCTVSPWPWDPCVQGWFSTIPFPPSQVSQEFHLPIFLFLLWTRTVSTSSISFLLAQSWDRTPYPASVSAVSEGTQLCLTGPGLCDYTLTHTPKSKPWILQKRLGKGNHEGYSSPLTSRSPFPHL